MFWSLGFAVCLIASSPRDIEKTAVPTDKGLELHWYPKLPSIKGWVRVNPRQYPDIAALVPSGATFSNARSVIHGRAIYIPRMDKGMSLEKLITEDAEAIKAQYPRAKVTKVREMKTGRGKKMATYLYQYDPTRDMTWDKVAFAKEGDFFVILTLSSKNLDSFKRDEKTFDREVATYR